jgi:biotin synthase
MINKTLLSLASQVINGKDLKAAQAWQLVELSEEEGIYELYFLANKIKGYFKGKKVSFCSIINAKSGRCSEDCKFCAQSSHYKTEIKIYPLVSIEEIVKGSDEAWRIGAIRYSIVTAGRKIKNDSEFNVICEAIKKIKKEGKILPCASLGKLTKQQAKMLKDSGLSRYHHNLETDEEFFSALCTTHSFKERVETIKIAKEEGLEVCCGGIFGVGETWQARLNLAFKLKELEVDSIPLNFLNPIKGTPFENITPLHPLEILRIIAIFRFIHPKREIRICGGREVNLRDLQSWMYYAGADGAIIGNYLTTLGRPPEEDLKLIKDLGLEMEITNGRKY